MRLAGCDSRTRREALAGREVWLRRSDLPTPRDDEYYLADLEGRDAVRAEEGLHLGRITGILDTGAHPVLSVTGRGREYLIPFHAGVLVSHCRGAGGAAVAARVARDQRPLTAGGQAGRMLFDILTIFPELFSSPLAEGILRRAIAAGQIRVRLHNIRDYATDRHRMTDDRPFGGGEGMVMKPEPLLAALDDVRREGEPGRVILLSPRGARYCQRTAERFAACPRLILVCGRYEGVDERFARCCIDEEISLGDYILTGGELGAMVIVDSVTRLLPGVLGSEDSARNDTFSRGLLKHSQYTRPREFHGDGCPGSAAVRETMRPLASTGSWNQFARPCAGGRNCWAA